MPIVTPIIILVIGSGGREAAIIKTLHKSKLPNTIYCMGTNYNPLIIDLCSFVYFSNMTFLVDFCKQKQIPFSAACTKSQC